MAMHSSMTDRSTGRVRSSRLRTALVVVRSSSGSRGRSSLMRGGLAPQRRGGSEGTMSELGRIVQVAYAVDDLDAGAQDFARRVGAGPFFVRRHIELAAAFHGGEPAVFDHSSAYGRWGSVQVELVHVHRVRPTALAEIVKQRAGIHHVAWFVSDLAAEQRRLSAVRWPEVLAAETAS